jgi:hypothetical protein
MRCSIDEKPLMLSQVLNRVVPIDINYAYKTYSFNNDEDLAKIVSSNIRPPFEKTWYEWTLRNDHDPALHVAGMSERTISSHPGFASKSPQKNDLTKIVLTFYFDHELRKMRDAPLDMVWGADFHDSIFSSGDLNQIVKSNRPTKIGIQRAGKNPDGLNFCAYFVGIILWSWMLLSCKNVTTVETHPSSRRRDAQKDPTRVVYRELKVSVAPGQRAQPTAGADDSGHGVAFHVRRGHFADYTNGNGLFGKYKGRYWIPPTTVGNPSYGTVLKSYSLTN